MPDEWTAGVLAAAAPLRNYRGKRRWAVKITGQRLVIREDVLTLPFDPVNHIGDTVMYRLQGDRLHIAELRVI